MTTGTMQSLETLPEGKNSSGTMEPIASALQAMFSQAVGTNQLDLVRHYLTLKPRLANMVGECTLYLFVCALILQIG